MKRPAKKTIRKWAKIISDDYMHWTDEELEYALDFTKYCEFEIVEGDKGVLGWMTFKDIDTKIKTAAIIFYVKPEYRGSKIFFQMIHRLEEIAKEEGSSQIVIGQSISGYKEDQFNQIFEHFGYKKIGYVKDL